MDINRQDYDKLPFAIRQGALHLWGTHLSDYSHADQVHKLYSFSGFFAEVCYRNQELTGIYTFATTAGLEPYMDTINWQDLLP